MRLWRAVAAVVRRRASVLFPRRASSGWRTGALGGFGLAAGFTVAHADNGEGDVPATGEKDILSNMTDADYDNMLNMMVQDAKCPECARKMLQGPCGMNLMRLLLCYTKGDDKANLEACAQEFGPALQACLERHKDYYGLHEDAEPSVDLGDADEEQQQPAVHA
ncbi:GCK domain-containing protein [Plasmodiophora brassicae]|uniref:GCK domain-containing protein n=1 Tax=Plasmodiophora brassicae TaxID=37360 RepID=A0A0G4IXP0_PLABS|nr:hypothetical protein PBRA_007751 [Plasmodiophora brassicae]SPQ99057.1 unnamed protein product [Plasmodiophora brassicae]